MSAKAEMYLRQAEADASYFDDVAEHVIALASRDATRILEVGCGAGGTLRTLAERAPGAIETVGVEIERGAADRASAVLSAVYRFDAEEEALDDEYLGHFDLLIMNYVLEHFVDPWEGLRRWLPFVREGGHVLIGVPNVAHYKVLWRLLFRDEWQHEPFGVMDWTHLRYFTGRSIVLLVESLGLRVVERKPISLALEESWKARLVARLFPPSRRFFNLSYLVLAEKQSVEIPAVIPYGPRYTC